MRLRASTIAATALVLAAPPAMAADATVRVDDDFFSPETVQIDPGNTVTWQWVGPRGNHSVTTRSGQTESFDSDPGNDSPMHLPGSPPFSFRFDRGGEVNYFCKVHPYSMTGTVRIGTPPPDITAPALRSPRARVGRRAVKVGFSLSEGATVELKVASARRPRKALRLVRKRLAKGRRSLQVRRRGLRRGRYRATLTATDSAGNKSKVARASFRIR